MDPRTFTRVVQISQGETISGQNTVSSLAGTAGGSDVTATTAQAHGYKAGDKVLISGATQTEFNGLFTILTVPSTTTFTYRTLRPLTVALATTAGTIISNKDVDMQGAMLASIEIPDFTGTAISFQGTSMDARLGTYRPLETSATGNAAVAWAVGANQIALPESAEEIITGLAGIRVVSGSAEAAARTLTLHFIRTNQ